MTRAIDVIDRAIAEHGPQRVQEALEPFVSPSRRARFDEVLGSRIESLTVVLENLYDAHNGAAAIRSVEAFGLSDVHAVETTTRFKIARGITIGCEQWLDVHRHRDIDSCAEMLKARGFVLTATLPEAETSLDELDGGKKRALLFGNEHEGLSQRAVSLCDEVIRIPMYGFTQSFNLSVSVALTVERAAALRREALGRIGDLDERRKHFLRARWHAVGVRGAAGIIERHVAALTR